MNPAFRTALAIISTALALAPAVVFLSVKQLDLWALWLAGICSLLAGLGFVYAFPPKNQSFKILHGIFLGGFLFTCNLVVAFFVGCSRVFH